jgi:hypothetical protein
METREALYQAAVNGETLFRFGIYGVAFAISIIAQDEVIPAIERAIWRIFGRGSK